MRIILSLTFIILCSFVQAQEKNTHVLVLGLDGFSAEGFKKAKHPNLDRMIADGALSITTRPVMPSVTLPNWTSHFTGSGPEEHGITNNAWTLSTHELSSVETDQEGYYPSIFKVLKDEVKNVKTAYYYNWKELIYPINKKYLDEISFQENDEYLDNYNKTFDFLVKNQKNPTLAFLYSVHTDHAGHGFGWMSPEYIAAIEQADVAIGNLLEKLKKAGLYESTHFLLITDHGGKNKGHGGVSMVEMEVPWAITGPKIKKQGLFTQYNSNKNTSLVLAKIFGAKKLPFSWTGSAPQFLFK
jgi:predicted AlkP superfamily pyrophosphatase or phosphodiesterase